MGYRLLLERPTPDALRGGVPRYAASVGLAVPAGLIEQVLKRYREEAATCGASEPRDLIERVRDLCKLHAAVRARRGPVSTAWNAYFGLTVCNGAGGGAHLMLNQPIRRPCRPHGWRRGASHARCRPCEGRSAVCARCEAQWAGAPAARLLEPVVERMSLRVGFDPNRMPVGLNDLAM